MIKASGVNIALWSQFAYMRQELINNHFMIVLYAEHRKDASGPEFFSTGFTIWLRAGFFFFSLWKCTIWIFIATTIFIMTYGIAIRANFLLFWGGEVDLTLFLCPPWPGRCVCACPLLILSFVHIVSNIDSALLTCQPSSYSTAITVDTFGNFCQIFSLLVNLDYIPAWAYYNFFFISTYVPFLLISYILSCIKQLRNFYEVFHQHMESKSRAVCNPLLCSSCVFEQFVFLLWSVRIKLYIQKQLSGQSFCIWFPC